MQGRPFDFAPFGYAQDLRQDKPFDFAQDKPGVRGFRERRSV